MTAVAVITGGASGFGRALGTGCATRGMDVVLLGDGVVVSVVSPSGMLSRHLETSEAAQPAHLRRPIAHDDDFHAMHESNPTMSQLLATPEEAAAGVIDALLSDRRYVITHDEFVDAIDARAAELRMGAEAAR